MTAAFAASGFATAILKELTAAETKDKSRWTTVKLGMSQTLLRFHQLSCVRACVRAYVCVCVFKKEKKSGSGIYKKGKIQG